MENKKIHTPAAAVLQAICVLLSMVSIVRILGYASQYPIAGYIFPILNLALCGVLFLKKRDIVLAGVLGAFVLYRLYYLLRSFSVFNFLFFAGYGIALVFALAFSQPQVIKADLSKVRELAKKLFFLPALLLLVVFLRTILSNTIPYIGDYSFFLFLRILFGYVDEIVHCVAMLLLVQWLIDPYEKPAAPVTVPAATGTPVPEAFSEAYCGLGKHIVLCLFTFGIWYMIWIYRATKYLNSAPGAQYYYPGRKLLLCLFVPFYQIYWFYKHGQRIDLLSKEKKLPHSDMATLCLILGIFIPIVACILMQDRINSLCTVKLEE